MSMITPGPWEQNGEAVDAENNSVLNIAVCNMARVAHGWSGTDYTTQEHQIANARLIASAPDLLSALQRVMAHNVPLTGNPTHAQQVEFWQDEKAQGRGDADDMLAALAAIAKATGESL